MEYITTKEASAKWGISTIRITVLANEGRIPGAQRVGRSWLIPASATKPQERKADHSGSAKKKVNENNDFSFPLYHFRPDWSSIKQSHLSAQEQKLLLAETAVLECRFSDAYPILESILQAPDNITIEIGCLWNAAICCISLNKPEVFSKYFLRLQLLFSEDFPHHDDLMVVLDILKTYVDTLATSAIKYNHLDDINEQCIPMTCLLAGYSQLSKETLNTNSSEVNLLELNLHLLKNYSSVISLEFLHLHLLGIYALRNDMSTAEKHAKLAVQITFENKYYFPLVTYYRYFTEIFDSILAQYPDDFQTHCNELVEQYNNNFTAFISSISEKSSLSKLSDSDIPFIYCVLMNLSNNAIAERLTISPRTVKRRLESLFYTLGVSNKKELRDFLQNNL